MRLNNFVIFLLTPIFLYFIFYINFYVGVFHNNSFYDHAFSKYDIVNKFINYNIKKIHKGVLKYLQFSEQNKLDKNFFNIREISHLKDVMLLFKFLEIIFKVFLVILIMLAIYYIHYYSLKFFWLLILKSLLIASIISLISIIALVILIMSDFDASFTGMHNIFFESGTWLFSPIDNIVNLYVENFFYDMGLMLGKRILGSSLFLLIFSFIFYKKNK